MASILSKEHFQEMREDELLKEVLIPLLKAMGYKDVFEYHGGDTEQGKDIVCWKANSLGGRENLAIVAKAVRLTGKASPAKGTAAEVQMQIQQCFGKTYLDPVNGEEQAIHQCWVITNKNIGKQAEEAISAALSPMGISRDVKFVNGDKLWELIENYLPIKAVLQKLDDVNKTFDTIDTHYRPVAMLMNTGIKIGVAEKFPGASQEKPFEINFTFAFPDTPEGRIAKNAFERSITTGTPVDIEAPYIQSIKFPDSFNQLIGDQFKQSSLHIEPLINQVQFLARIQLKCDDGDGFILNYVQFKVIQSGTEEVTLSNEDQPIPVQIKLVLSLKEQKATVHFHIPVAQLNVYQLLDVLYLMRAISKPMVAQIIHLDTGILFFEQHQIVGVCEAPDPRFIEALKDLAAIQIKLQQPIMYPNRELTLDEINTIEQLRIILHEGKQVLKWNTLNLAMLPEGVRILLKTFENGKSGTLVFRSQETVSLFDIELPLGEVETRIEKVELINKQEIQKHLDEVQNDETPIECNFVPVDDSPVIKKYLNWQQQIISS
jgi:hypothetical protein